MIGRSRIERFAVVGDQPVNDDALVAAVAAHDQGAWRAVVDRHLGAVVACAWHMLHDRAEAEDVAQEVFLRLRTKAGSWQPGPVALGAWLNRVAVNLSIDRLRRLKLRRLFTSEIADPDAFAGAGPERDFAITREVARAVSRLTTRQRAALTLVHYQGFSGREAAEILGVTEEAVESLLSRARRSLRQELEGTVTDLLGDV